jgi:NAD(P)H-nitrite reductase large subunit
MAATRLKVAGIEHASMGVTEPSAPTDETVQFAEPRRGTYKKLIIRDGRLIGGIMLGDGGKTTQLLHAFERNLPLPDERIRLLFDLGAPTARMTLEQLPLEAQVCNCERSGHHNPSARSDTGRRCSKFTVSFKACSPSTAAASKPPSPPSGD